MLSLVWEKEQLASIKLESGGGKAAAEPSWAKGRPKRLSVSLTHARSPGPVHSRHITLLILILFMLLGARAEQLRATKAAV